MTTINELIKQFNLEPYNKQINETDIGEYTFKEKKEYDDGRMIKLTNPENPNYILILVEDRPVFAMLCHIKDDGEIKTKAWRTTQDGITTYYMETPTPLQEMIKE